jgi:hypothetical protein
VKVQIIYRNGKPEYAVLPYPDYLLLLEKAESRQLLSKINAVCAGEPDQEEIETMKFIRSHMKKLGKSEEWE